MFTTHVLPLPLHSSASPTARPCLPTGSRSALADSTNVNSRSNIYGPGYPKASVYPTSSARTGCGWSDFESSTGSISTSCHSRHHPLSSTPSLFSVTCKAPPTVCISLSAACSQSIPGELLCGSRVQGLELDLPDVRSVVPFPSTPLDGDMDVDMLDGTCVPCPSGHLPPAGQAPRKRRSAHTSVSSPQGSPGKDAKQKRPRKSRRQVAELWWLGVVHRSILHGIEGRQSVGELDTSDRLLSGLRDFDAMDRVLVEKIQKRLAENGCGEGRALPNPLPRISSPSISVPSLNLLAPSRRTPPIDSASFTLSSELNPKGNSTLSDGTAISIPAAKTPPYPSSSITSRSSIASSTSASHRRHVRFEIPQRPHQTQTQPHPSIPRRSPSPSARMGTVSANAQTHTLTMPQLVASLTLAYRERSRLRFRGRTYKVTECGKDAGRPPPSVPCQAVQCDDGGAIHDKERVHQLFTARAKLSSAPERKSPLSRVAYAES